MVLHEEEDHMKIYGWHISFSAKVYQGDESYPIKELEERAELPKQMVDEKTRSLQQAIYERRQAEESLRENQKLLQGLLESIQDGINILNPDVSSIRQVNSTIGKWHSQNTPLEGLKCFQVYQKREVCNNCLKASLFGERQNGERRGLCKNRAGGQVDRTL